MSGSVSGVSVPVSPPRAGLTTENLVNLGSQERFGAFCFTRTATTEGRGRGLSPSFIAQLQIRVASALHVPGV